MPPPMHANLANLGYKPDLRRRSSSASTEVDIREIIEEAFNKVDLNGNGQLSPSEIAESLKGLLTLKDPENDADTICWAIDTDGDGSISKDEFHEFLRPTIMHHLSTGQCPLDLERILSDAFSNVLASARVKRDAIIQAFMESEKATKQSTMGSSSNLFGASWMHKLYEEMYNNPQNDPNAPCYRAGRGEYLKNKLKELIAEEDKVNAPPSKPKNFNPWERRSSVGHGTSTADAKRAAFRKAISAPDDDAAIVKSFASLWLDKIGEMERRNSTEN